MVVILQLDCVRTSIRPTRGTANVVCAYRRDEGEDMPGSPKTRKIAKEEGVKFIFNLQPLALETDSPVMWLALKWWKQPWVNGWGQSSSPWTRWRQWACSWKAITRSAQRLVSTSCDGMARTIWWQARPMGAHQLRRQEFQYQTTNSKIFAGVMLFEDLT